MEGTCKKLDSSKYDKFHFIFRKTQNSNDIDINIHINLQENDPDDTGIKRKRRKEGWKEAARRDFDNTFSSVADELYDKASRPRTEQVQGLICIDY